MLSDRILLGGYNAIDNSPQLCDSSLSTYLFLDKVNNETQMESLKKIEATNNNNVNNSDTDSKNENNNTNISSNTNLGSANNPSNVICNNTSKIKRERLSPGTNGDGQCSLSRSRSVTSSPIRGTPNQITHHNNDIQLQNLSTNFISQIKNRNSDFSNRNYSDFMRSLAAKYHNSYPNDTGTSRRNTFLVNSKINQPSKPNTNNNTNGSSLKEQVLPLESGKTTQNTPTTTNTSSVPTFVQTFLSSLSFSPGVFPPLIDMSSTQALVTLARAAKEAEVNTILLSAQKKTSLPNDTFLSTHAPNLTAALQQAAQFASPALLYSAQLQQQIQQRQQQQQQQQQQPLNRQSSPTHESFANSSGEKQMTASPLDLSSAPPTKRYKAESSSSSDTELNYNNIPSTSGTQNTSSLPKNKSIAAETVTNEASIVETTPSASTVAVPFRQCQAQNDEVNAWSVDDVCSFVESIDICSTYVKNFREQCIDGSGLPLLTEDHLLNQLGMRLGPALKLRTMLAKKIGGPCPCVSCSSHAQLFAAAQAAAVTVSSTTTSTALATFTSKS